jgi:hypothetical protein
MSVESEDRVKRIAELIGSQKYQVDSVAVADSLLRRVRWDDVPDIEPLLPRERRWRRILRLRGCARVRRLATFTVRTRPQLSS